MKNLIINITSFFSSQLNIFTSYFCGLLFKDHRCLLFFLSDSAIHLLIFIVVGDVIKFTLCSMKQKPYLCENPWIHDIGVKGNLATTRPSNIEENVDSSAVKAKPIASILFILNMLISRFVAFNLSSSLSIFRFAVRSASAAVSFWNIAFIMVKRSIAGCVLLLYLNYY